jgi:hypothetical protein
MAGYYVLIGKTPYQVFDMTDWGIWLESAIKNGTKHVKQSYIGEVLVSTTFLGLDHSFGGSVPILFETLVFGGRLDGEMERYATYEEAEAGHERMCGLVMEAENNPAPPKRNIRLIRE